MESVDAAERHEGLFVLWPDASMVTGVDPESVTTDTTQLTLFGELVDCFPPVSETPSSEEIWMRHDCFVERLSTIAEQEDPHDMLAAVEVLHLSRPDLTTVCHNAAHEAGQRAMERIWEEAPPDADRMDLLAELLTETSTACMGGLVHGIFDALGFADPSLEEYNRLPELCRELHSIPGFDCTDAAGHAAWDATEDLRAAVELCNVWEDVSQRFGCTEGIIMRIFQRQELTDSFYYGSPTIPGFDEQRWFDEVTGLCDEWPDDVLPEGVPEGPVDACYSGTIYLLFKPFNFMASANSADLEAGFDELLYWLRFVEDGCNSYPGSGPDVCMWKVGWYTTPGVMFDPDLSERLCLSLSSHVDDCLEAREIRLAEFEEMSA